LVTGFRLARPLAAPHGLVANLVSRTA